MKACEEDPGSKEFGAHMRDDLYDPAILHTIKLHQLYAACSVLGLYQEGLRPDSVALLCYQ